MNTGQASWETWSVLWNLGTNLAVAIGLIKLVEISAEFSGCRTFTCKLTCSQQFDIYMHRQ
jgi:hypothetical protein